MSERPGRGPATPEGAARAFVDAITWGEHRTVWDLLGTEGRQTVLRVAANHGMDDALVARLRDGTATERETNEFLTDLTNGLRADLAGNDLDNLEYHVDPEAPGPDRARVVLEVPLPELLDRGAGGLPVGSVELSTDGQRWRVERLVPRAPAT
ncbi:MAG: hypothetical protein ACRDZ9_02575 [Acidimicrobiales bacterium]